MTLRFQTYTYRSTHTTVGSYFSSQILSLKLLHYPARRQFSEEDSWAWTESLKGWHTAFGCIWKRHMFSNFQQTALLTREKHVSRIRIWLPILVWSKLILRLCSLFGKYQKCFVCTLKLYSLNAVQAERIIVCSSGTQNYSLGHVLLKFLLLFCIFLYFLIYLIKY